MFFGWSSKKEESLILELLIIEKLLYDILLGKDLSYVWSCEKKILEFEFYALLNLFKSDKNIFFVKFWDIWDFFRIGEGEKLISNYFQSLLLFLTFYLIFKI